MKNIVVKVLVIILSVSVYFNISSFYNNRNLENEIGNLENEISNLEATINDFDNVVPSNDTCDKLYEITLTVIVEKDDLVESVIHCTNKAYLGDALDELVDEMQIVYDPLYSKDYAMGRYVHSFYGVSKVFEEYYEININGVRASYGVDLTELEDEAVYEFTLVRWA